MKSAQLELAEQNTQLRETLTATKTELAAAHSDLDFFNAQAHSKKQVVEAAPAKAEPIEELETLLLQAPTVSQTADGLVARFEFKPTGTDLPEQITLVVRVPGDSEVKILSLKPVTEPGYFGVECHVNTAGNLGMIEGSPSDLGALAFELTVSKPVKAIVRGSEGIKDFEVDITPNGCTVRQL